MVVQTQWNKFTQEKLLSYVVFAGALFHQPPQAQMSVSSVLPQQLTLQVVLPSKLFSISAGLVSAI